jgi:hypothetical protein
MKRLALAVLAAAPLLAGAQDAAPIAPAVARPSMAGEAAPGPVAPPPSAVFIGAGIGQTIVVSNRTEQSAATIRFRIGVPRSTRLALGIEGGLSDDGSQFYDVGAAFFPWDGRFFARAALGTTIGRGPNALTGLGWAFGGRRGLNVTVNLDLQRHMTTGRFWVGQGGTSTVSTWLGLDWY